MFDNLQEAQYNMLRLIVSDEGYRNINPSYRFIGQGFIDTILRKIIFVSTQNVDLYKQYKDSFDEICVRMLSHSQESSIIQNKRSQLLTFLGEMYVLKRFNFLQELEQEFTDILKQALANTELNNAQCSVIEKQNEIHNQTFVALNSIVDLLDKEEKNLQIEPSFIEESTKQRLLQSQIDEYLAKIHRYRVELKYLYQQMKIPQPQFIKQRQQDESYVVTVKLEFKSVYLNNRKVSFEESSRGDYCEETTERASYLMAKTIYMTIPEMWKDFVAIKKKKGLIS